MENPISGGRLLLLTCGIAVCAGAACGNGSAGPDLAQTSSPTHPSSPAQPPPTSPSPISPSPTSPSPSAQARQALAQCGESGDFLRMWIDLDARERRAMTVAQDVTTALQAHWERHRLLVAAATADRRAFDSGAVSRFASTIAAHTHVSPPRWWSAVLAEGIEFVDGGPTAYPTGPDVQAARYVASHRLAQGVVRTRGDVVLTEQADGRLEIRTPTGRAMVLPTALELPVRAASHLEANVTADHAIVVPFEPSTGGVPFEVRRIDPTTGTVRWTATACAAGRQYLGGLGNLVLEIVIQDDQVAVFGAESHDVWIDTFELTTGEPLWRFSSEVWMTRHR